MHGLSKVVSLMCTALFLDKSHKYVSVSLIDLNQGLKRQVYMIVFLGLKLSVFNILTNMYFLSQKYIFHNILAFRSFQPYILYNMNIKSHIAIILRHSLDLLDSWFKSYVERLLEKYSVKTNVLIYIYQKKSFYSISEC